jgi:hypothetical protein
MASAETALLVDPVQGLPDVALAIEARPMADLEARGDVVEPADEHAQPACGGSVELVWSPSTPAIREAVVDPLDGLQGLAVGKRTDVGDGHFVLGEGRQERVLLEDLVAGPAVGSVELGHDAAAVLQADLVDPVLEGVERVAQPRGLEAPRVDRVEDPVRGQAEEEICGGGAGHGVTVAVGRRS